MKHKLRSAVCTEGRRMAGARALWVAAGMKHEQMDRTTWLIWSGVQYDCC